MRIVKYVYSGILVIGVLIACSFVTGCAGMMDLEKINNRQDEPLRFLALGDSYTIGTGVNEVQRWPVQLADFLRESGFDVEEPLIIARNGWTTGDLLDGIADIEITGPFDFVSLLIGVNNQYRGYPESEYRVEFRKLLKIAGEYAGGRWDRVVVLSIPDWGAAPFAEGLDRSEIGAEIDAFNAINREETELAGAHYLDVTPLSRRVLAEPELAAEDGLHLSGEMYQMWARMVLDLVAPVIRGEQG